MTREDYIKFLFLKRKKKDFFYLMENYKILYYQPNEKAKIQIFFVSHHAPKSLIAPNPLKSLILSATPARYAKSRILCSFVARHAM